MQQEENSFWQTSLVSAYSSRFHQKVRDALQKFTCSYESYCANQLCRFLAKTNNAQTQDVDATIRRRDHAREELREQASPQLLLDGYREYFSHPVQSRYTAVTFSPRKSLMLRLRSWFQSDPKAVLFAGSALVAAMAVGAFCLARWVRKR